MNSLAHNQKFDQLNWVNRPLLARLCRVIFNSGPKKAGARRGYAGVALVQVVYNGIGIGTEQKWRGYAGVALMQVAQTTGFTVSLLIINTLALDKLTT